MVVCKREESDIARQRPTPSRRIAKGVVATMVAAAVAAAPCGYAFALQRAPEDAEATAVAHEQRTGEALDTAALAQAAIDRGIAGAEALSLYLSGSDVAEQDFLAIDAVALSELDVDVANEVKAVQDEINAGADEGGEATDPSDPAEPTDPVDPSEPTDPADPSDPDDPSADEGSDPADPTDPGEGEGDDPADPADPGDDAAGSDSEDPAGSGDAADPAPDDTGTAAGQAPDQSVSADEWDEYVSPYPTWSYEGDTTYTPSNVSVNLTTQKFVAVIGEQAREIAQENDLYASVMIAQAILESGSGNSALARTPNNNLFGIKGTYEGNGVVMRTAEDDGTGSLYYIGSRFRVYPSTYESLGDYASLLKNGLSGFYAPAWKSNSDSYVEACNYLEGRYATDTSYSEKLQGIIEAYDLTRYDEPLDYETVQTYKVQATDPETGEPAVNALTGEPIMEERTLVDLVTELTSHLGDEYVWGAASPGGFDCSGLAYYCYQEALGIELPRTTYYQCLEGEDVDFDDLHMGDLLFFTNDENEASHVAIYLGEGCYIEAPNFGEVVTVTSMSEKMPDFAKRIVETRQTEETFDAEAFLARFDESALVRPSRAVHIEVSPRLPIERIFSEEVLRSLR